MTAVTIDLQAVAIQDVTVSEDTLSVDLVDGHTISVPLGWYPRLWHASGRRRAQQLAFNRQWRRRSLA